MLNKILAAVQTWDPSPPSWLYIWRSRVRQGIGLCDIAYNIESQDAWCNTHKRWAWDACSARAIRAAVDAAENESWLRSMAFSIRVRLGYE